VRTIDFNTVLFEALQLAGQDRNNLVSQPETFQQFRDFANGRIRYAWDAFEWPYATRFTQVTVNEVSGVQEASYPAEADEIIGVYTENPLAKTNIKEVQFRIYDNGSERKIVFINNPGDCWVEYKVKKPYIFGDPYKNDIVYRTGAQVFFDTESESGSLSPQMGRGYRGNFYNCISDTTVGTKPTSTGGANKWQKVDIPYFMAAYLPRAVHADWLRSEMQLDVARLAEEEAEMVLTEEISKVTKLQGQANRINIINNY
jgi:hypothetical protein